MCADKQCTELSVKLERECKAHSADLDRLQREMAEKEAKWQGDRSEYRAQLQTEKNNLLRIIQQKEAELEAERAKRKEVRTAHAAVHPLTQTHSVPCAVVLTRLVVVCRRN